MRISVVIPVYNEEHTIGALHERLLSVLQKRRDPFEIIFVDDKSTDGTWRELQKLSPVKALRLFRNSGQTLACAAGIQEAIGEIIITMDGDLENDPADIPSLLQRLQEGFDVVSGWRKDRWKNHIFLRRIPSTLASILISFVSGTRLHDHGCAFRAWRKEVLMQLNLTGDMHRMIAAHAAQEGARVTEIPIAFHPREFGKSKYGVSRMFRVLLDVIAFHFFYRYARRPLHFFGGIVFLVMMYFKYFDGKSFIDTPLPILVALLVMIGFQFILMGLIAELIIRTQNPPGPPVQEIIEQ
jgi:glycosyltransferase involved in cell wall biosynthesis